ncbi:MAG: S1C family serine protease [Candidatus Xenobium sp.]|jgi:serine protease Do|nr:PDZ domain-containing protein [Burkholderiales bacterium]
MTRRFNIRGNALIALLAGLLGVLVGAGLILLAVWFRQPPPARPGIVAVPTPTTTAVPVRPSRPQEIPPGSVAYAVAQVEPAVVNIDTTVRVRRRIIQDGPFGPGYWGETQVEEIPQGMGTGVLVSPEGLILTNNHVIRQAQGITVTLTDDRQFPARVLGTDPLTDLAILKIDDPKPFPVAHLESSEGMRTGDWVVALGNPLGIGQTATVGVLSARGRRLADASQALSDLLQTDAAINPGNSGGPLVNLQGQVIGINTAIIRGAQGIGFAIPAETALRILNDLQEHGRVVRPFLGIEMGDLTPALRRYLELPQSTKGVVVGRILPQSPADRAGMKPGDLITSLEGQPTLTAADLQARVRSLAVGQKVKVSLLRQKKPLELTVELQEMPSRLIPGR